MTKKTIEDRKQDFKELLSNYLLKYDKDLLNEFYEYWTAHNENSKKMRFELSKNQPFYTNYRLATWAKNKKKFNKNTSVNQNQKITAAQALQNKIFGHE